MTDSLLKFSGCLRKEPAGLSRDRQLVVKTEKLSFHFELLEGCCVGSPRSSEMPSAELPSLPNAGICGGRAMFFRLLKSERGEACVRDAFLACLLLS